MQGGGGINFCASIQCMGDFSGLIFEGHGIVEFLQGGAALAPVFPQCRLALCNADHIIMSTLFSLEGKYILTEEVQYSILSSIINTQAF